MGKHKQKHKSASSKHKKHKSSRCRSSTDESSSEDEWVEMSPAPLKQQPRQVEEKEEVKDISQRDEWMSNAALFPCVTRDQIRQSKDKKKDEKEDKYMLDKLGQTDRELNPYWKDGGSGLPPEASVSADSLRQASVTVGDQGAAWLRKALQRAKEQAAEQGCSLQQVVAERWESLEKLENMIAAAEERERKVDRREEIKYKSTEDNRNRDRSSNNKLSGKNYNRNGESERFNKFGEASRKENSTKYFAKPDDSCSSSSSSSESGDRYKNRRDSRKYDSSDGDRSNSKYGKYVKQSTKEKRISSKHNESTDDDSDCRKKQHEKFGSRKPSSKGKFAKPCGSSSEEEKSSHQNDHKSLYNKERSKESEKYRSKKSNRPYLKPSQDYFSTKIDRFASENPKSYSKSGSGWRKKTETLDRTQDKDKKEDLKNCENFESSDSKKKNEEVDVEHDVKEEEPVLTDKEMNDLGAKLVKAELLGNQQLADELKAKLERARQSKASKPKAAETEKVVILTHTDSKGFTRPVSFGETPEPSGGRRKAKKVETHSAGKRTKYFADDDKYSLQEMFQREKLSTVEDSNEVFAKLASKGVGRDDSVRDMDDVFEETACVEEVEGRKQAKERQQAIEHSKRVARSLEHCQWCLESKRMLKHLIIAIGNSCYLCVPPYQSLTENHCLIVPSHHTPCSTQLDEDVWAEIQDFRKSVVKMFLSLDEDVVFFESARYLNKFPHMVLNCVPMPKETGDLAPIYFKKAIQECEMEWSNNKKLIELKGRDVRRAVPKGLPYFAVDFGMDSGFAHVIEDEKLFPQNFAQEIIGGMLDLDHTIWRKQRKQTFEEQSKKVIQLNKLWIPFDCTKKK